MGCQFGVGEINNFNSFWQTLFQHAAQHGLATAHFTNYFENTFP